MSIWKPSVTVAAVIERGGRFLLVEEISEGRHVLNQPAGHLDPGESLVEACRREVMEETAHHFDPTGLVGIYRWRYEPKDVTFLRFCFSGTAGGSVDRPLDKEIVALHWLSREELARRHAEHRSPLVQKCVDDFLAGRRYPLEVFSSEFQ
ncbi:MAG: 7,8-dihydro-8-oxoguanine-triphosphatase [Burkholderiales bacterium]|jgi:8-oxo-dGTP pyrophosphatase MutT (NUDIX family)|nr:7,8-dihydro-8-oxoguanine-triphosphatase [Burkholderiales bacterium]